MWNPLLCTIRGRPYIQSGTQLQGTLPLLTNAGHKERELLWSKNIYFLINYYIYESSLPTFCGFVCCKFDAIYFIMNKFKRN